MSKLEEMNGTKGKTGGLEEDGAEAGKISLRKILDGTKTSSI